MKLLKLFVFLNFLLLSSLSFGAVENYQFDPNHTFVLWHVNHFNFSNLTGKWLAEGNLMLDDKNPAKSTVKVTIKMAELSTGIPKLDEHLKGADFFDVEKYPTATFESTKVVVSGKTAKVTGTLTLHGVSKPITLDMKLNQMAVHPISEKKAVGFSGKAHLKRSEFDVGAYTPHVSDDVNLEIEAEASLAEQHDNATH